MQGESDGRLARASLDAIWLDALHDLRQPLQSGLLLVTAASLETDPEPRRHALRLAEQSLHDMQAMLDDLAYASRVVSGIAQSVGGCDNAEEIISMALDELSGCFGADNVTVRAGAISRMAVDPRMVHIATLGLLGTALKMARGASVVLTAGIEHGRLALMADVSRPEPPAGLLGAYFVELTPVPGLSPRRTTAPGLGLVGRIVTPIGGSVSCESSSAGNQRLMVHLATA
jgi:K+-sensing histidine kinase KdpD